MITAAEQSVAQNPAYRLATNGALFRSAPFFFQSGSDSSRLRAAALHHARCLHQARAPGIQRPEKTCRSARQMSRTITIMQREHDERDGERDERMLPDRDRRRPRRARAR